VGYKRPRLVHRVDALPRNRMGKVQRDQLHP
jgi:acyl-coenzyme A synthetase/AMP-(fatty) acid ligase